MKEQGVHVWASLALGLFFFVAYWGNGVMLDRHFITTDHIGTMAMGFADAFIGGAMLMLNPGGRGPQPPTGA